jgi:hypothetical protein
VVLNFSWPNHVPHPPSARNERISDQTAMASPEQRLRAHHRRPLPSGNFNESIKGVAKFASKRVVCIRIERLHAPARVWRRLIAFAAAAPKFRKMKILKTDVVKGGVQSLAAEVRAVA